MKRNLTETAQQLSLSRKYYLTSLVVVCAGMLVIGAWVSKNIADGVFKNTAASAGLYLNSFVAPEIQELSHTATLSQDTIEKLDRLYHDTPLHESVAAVKIWTNEGLVVYSTDRDIIGRTFAVEPGLAHAWDGRVNAKFADESHDERHLETDPGLRLLEIYIPIRARWNNRIIAVAEFYDDATTLSQNLRRAKFASWLVVGGVTTAMILALSGLVHQASRTIDNQKNKLQTQVQQLSVVFAQNQKLHERARSATSRAVELNEKYLRRLGTDLHDGPAQILSYGMLSLDHLTQVTCNCGNIKSTDTKRIEVFRTALGDALREIRDISAGLAVPELKDIELRQTLAKAKQAHERRTGSNVSLTISGELPTLSLPQKIGVYRLVQEALNNAFQHANGIEQRIIAHCDTHILELSVQDAGQGFDQNIALTGDRLGLSGMRERIESLGGRFFLETAPGYGTRVGARLPVIGDIDGNSIQEPGRSVRTRTNNVHF